MLFSHFPMPFPVFPGSFTHFHGRLDVFSITVISFTVIGRLFA